MNLNNTIYNLTSYLFPFVQDTSIVFYGNHLNKLAKIDIKKQIIDTGESKITISPNNRKPATITINKSTIPKNTFELSQFIEIQKDDDIRNKKCFDFRQLISPTMNGNQVTFIPFAIPEFFDLDCKTLIRKTNESVYPFEEIPKENRKEEYLKFLDDIAENLQKQKIVINTLSTPDFSFPISLQNFLLTDNILFCSKNRKDKIKRNLPLMSSGNQFDGYILNHIDTLEPMFNDYIRKVINDVDIQQTMFIFNQGIVNLRVDAKKFEGFKIDIWITTIAVGVTVNISSFHSIRVNNLTGFNQFEISIDLDSSDKKVEVSPNLPDIPGLPDVSDIINEIVDRLTSNYINRKINANAHIKIPLNFSNFNNYKLNLIITPFGLKTELKKL